MAFFDGFELAHVDTGDATLRVRRAGDGPPVVLLHGHPRTQKVEPYTKRAVAGDIVGLMRALGHERFPSSATTAAPSSRFGSRSTTPR